MRRVRPHIFTILLILTTLVTVWTSSNINWGKDRWTRIIKVDGNGYYAYLPAIFIYHDLNFGFFEDIASREGYENMKYEYRYDHNGHIVNKYFAGTALAQFPFFLTAHFYYWLTGQSMDGYSRLYLIAINLASIFYLVVSLIFLNKILSLYGISEVNKALALTATVFGTNLFYYTVYEPSMSHVYSLAFVTMFFYFTLKYFREFHSKYLIIAALLLGMTVLIRPINILVLSAVPFLSGDWKTLRKSLHHKIIYGKTTILALVIFIIPLLLQALIYYLQTGRPWVYSYGEERFYFDQPNIIKMLFSYRKGMFIYAPVLFVSLGGLYFLFKRKVSLVFFWLSSFLLITYVLSCWHQWYYGGSFGSRVFIEYYALFAILLGALLQGIKRRGPRIALNSLLIILTAYSIIQTYQYYAGIIHWSEMDRELYWEVFLKFK